MEAIKIIHYVCSECSFDYDTEEEANKCCEEIK